jgi:hypothetical protein
MLLDGEGAYRHDHFNGADTVAAAQGSSSPLIDLSSRARTASPCHASMLNL